METNEIQRAVENAVGEWGRLQDLRRRPVELSRGAVNALVSMVVNIAQDPSPQWAEFDADATQRVAVSLIPNALTDLRVNYRLQEKMITSWEIWHSLSRLLDRWCPVPKNL